MADLTQQPIAQGLPPASPTPRPATIPQATIHGGPVPSVAAKHQPWSVIFAVLALFISLVGSFILYFLNVSTQSQINYSETVLKDLNTELSQPPLAQVDQQLTLVNSTLQGYKAASQKKVDYTVITDALPKLTPKDMKLESLIIDAKGNLRISARASSFLSAGKALLAYRQAPFLTNVTISGLALETTEQQATASTSFDLVATIKKEALLPQPTPAANPSPVASPADPTSSAASSATTPNQGPTQ